MAKAPTGKQTVEGKPKKKAAPPRNKNAAPVAIDLQKRSRMDASMAEAQQAVMAAVASIALMVQDQAKETEAE